MNIWKQESHRLVWRVPISTQHPTTKWVAHLIRDTKKTNKLFVTPCGKEVNPGFALNPIMGSTKCQQCERVENGNDSD